MHLVDTHAHLDMDDFDSDREEMLARARAAGVEKIITVGIDVVSSKKAIELAEKHDRIYAAAGVHPHDASKIERADIARLRELAQHHRVVAIGEIGLDFYRNFSPKEKQVQAVNWQLDLAADLNLPVIIHARQAAGDTVNVLTEWVKRSHTAKYMPRGVIHCFSEDETVAQQYLKLGFFISFAGYVSYPSSKAARVAKSIPLDRIMVETDSPFLPPQQYRGKRSEPAYVAMTANVVANAIGIPVEEFARKTTENAMRLFKI
ncbi:MAG TPA: TatD family hydrolase [Dehalococcoidales bacterium]|nr:TatD family hydrolase [Dehalococcoidales bacterium]